MHYSPGCPACGLPHGHLVHRYRPAPAPALLAPVSRAEHGQRQVTEQARAVATHEYTGMQGHTGAQRTGRASTSAGRVRHHACLRMHTCASGQECIMHA